MKIINLKLNKTNDGYFLDIDLDKDDVIIKITNVLLCKETLDDINIESRNEYGYDCGSWISGLFSRLLRVYGDISVTQKVKEMTLEEIEKALGYPVRIIEYSGSVVKTKI